MVTRPRYDPTMTRTDWAWTIVLAAGVTAFMAAALWLNIGTR